VQSLNQCLSGSSFQKEHLVPSFHSFFFCFFPSFLGFYYETFSPVLRPVPWIFKTSGSNHLKNKFRANPVYVQIMH